MYHKLRYTSTLHSFIRSLWEGVHPTVWVSPGWHLFSASPDWHFGAWLPDWHFFSHGT